MLRGRSSGTSLPPGPKRAIKVSPLSSTHCDQSLNQSLNCDEPVRRNKRGRPSKTHTVTCPSCSQLNNVIRDRCNECDHVLFKRGRPEVNSNNYMLCPSCGHTNNVKSSECSVCDHVLSDKGGRPESSNMLCPSCGHFNDVKSSKCSVCDHALRQADQRVPTCFAPLVVTSMM